MMLQQKIRKPGAPFHLLILILIAFILKMILQKMGVFSFNSDEAVVALMARHILQGERPIFFYGQAYMGSLDALLVAAGFLIFGQKVWVIRAVQACLYAAAMVMVYQLGKEGFKSTRAGLIAAAFMAIPTVNTTLYTTVSLGGYGEALLIGLCLLLFAFRIVERWRATKLVSLRDFFFFGLLSGLGLWAFGLALLFTVSGILYACIVLCEHKEKDWARILKGIPLCILGAIAGASPWIWYAATRGLTNLVVELTGSAVAVEHTSILVKTGQHLLNYALLGITAWLGIRPPWDVQWLVLPLIPVALIIWGGILVVAWRKLRQDGSFYVLLWIVFGVHFLAFIFTSFGADPSGRYFLPLVPAAALFAGGVYPAIQDRLKKAVWIPYVLLLVFNLGGVVQCATTNPPGITTQFGPETRVDQRYLRELISFLESQGEYHGYTNYWVAYPLAFLSREELIYIPSLPYHQDLRYTARDDRYSPYDDIVRNTDRAAYITTNTPELDGLIEQLLTDQQISYQETDIGDFHVFYHLSQPISPGEMGLTGYFIE